MEISNTYYYLQKHLIWFCIKNGIITILTVIIRLQKIGWRESPLSGSTDLFYSDSINQRESKEGV